MAGVPDSHSVSIIKTIGYRPDGEPGLLPFRMAVGPSTEFRRALRPIPLVQGLYRFFLFRLSYHMAVKKDARPADVRTCLARRWSISRRNRDGYEQEEIGKL